MPPPATAAPLRSARRAGKRRSPRATPARALRATAPALGVLTLNVGAAAPVRAAAILRWLAGRREDVLVLTETSGGPGTTLLVEGLRARGYTTHGTPDARDRGALIATRIPIRETMDAQLDVTLPWRAPAVILDTKPRLTVAGVYVPSRDRSPAKVARKEAFIGSLLAGIRRLPEDVRRSMLLVGDYNAVAKDHLPRISGFLPYEYDLHEQLADLDLAPAHVLRPRRVQPHSWIGRTGNGYLYDYVHAGADLHDRVRRCAYLHGPRERRLSDHAAVAVGVSLG